MNKLYIEYRVYFDPTTNQEMLKEVAELAQEAIYTLFDTAKEAHEGAPSPHDVTFELVMEVPEPKGSC